MKNPIWKYENEFRIVVVFKNNIPYDRVAMNFRIKDNDKGISIALGPETTEDEFDNLSNEFVDYGIRKTVKTSESAVSMMLVSKNKKLIR